MCACQKALPKAWNSRNLGVNGKKISGAGERSVPACWPVSSRNTGRADVEIEGRREGFSEPRSPRQHLHCSRSRFWGSKRGFLKRCVPTRGNTRLIHLTSHPGVKKTRPFLLCHESGGKYPPKKTKKHKKREGKISPKKKPQNPEF